MANILQGIKNVFVKIRDFFKNNKIVSFLREKYKEGKEWIGIDGLINLESSALLMIFLTLLISPVWAALITLIIVAIKCCVDAMNGSSNEKHDFICCIVGILFGIILSLPGII